MTPTDHMSVPKPIWSKLTTSGATNSGVPNNTCSFLPGSNLRAKPKSMILMRFPVRVRHNMFSGCAPEPRMRTEIYCLEHLERFEDNLHADLAQHWPSCQGAECFVCGRTRCPHIFVSWTRRKTFLSAQSRRQWLAQRARRQLFWNIKDKNIIIYKLWLLFLNQIFMFRKNKNLREQIITCRYYIEWRINITTLN